MFLSYSFNIVYVCKFTCGDVYSLFLPSIEDISKHAQAQAAVEEVTEGKVKNQNSCAVPQIAEECAMPESKNLFLTTKHKISY